MKLFSKNCAVLECTADGISVGRCWFYVGDNYICERHGDVRKIQEIYVETGQCTSELKLNERTGLCK